MGLLHSYTGRYEPQAGGLAGNLPILIALVAFSCDGRAAALGHVLLRCRAWRDMEWHSHECPHGRMFESFMAILVR